MSSHRSRCAIVLLLALTACPAPERVRTSPSVVPPTASPSPTISETQTPPSSLSACRSKRRWARLTSEHPRLSFEAPILTRSVPTFKVQDNRDQEGQDGLQYLAAAYCDMKSGNNGGQTFGGPTPDYFEGRGLAMYDARGWYRSGDEVKLRVGSRDRVVEPLEVLELPNGAAAIIFEPNTDPPMFELREDDLAAVVNFPDDVGGEFQSLAMHFIEQITVEQVVRAVRSLKFA